MKNKIEDLRNHLFATIEQLLDEDRPMDVKRAQAIANVGSAIINSAKVEIDYLKITGGSGSGFIAIDPPKKEESSIKALK
jgi:hypothetical protein